MNFIASEAMAAEPLPATTVNPQDNIIASIVPFALIFVVFYFLIIRPQQKKLKLHQALISTIKKGDKVILSSGIVGKVTKPENTEGLIEVEIADNVYVKVVAGTISNVNPNEKVSNDNNKKAA